MIVDYIKEYKKATRKEIDALLSDKLSSVLSAKQKTAKISNLLSALRRDQRIKTDKGKVWVLVK